MRSRSGTVGIFDRIYQFLEPPALRGEVARSRAADDFAAVRSRLEELRRERAWVWTGNNRDAEQPQIRAARSNPTPAAKPRLSPVIRWALFK
jgi:hypothetical protein